MWPLTREAPEKAFYLPLLSLKHLLLAASLNSTQTCLELSHVPQSVFLVKSESKILSLFGFSLSTRSV